MFKSRSYKNPELDEAGADIPPVKQHPRRNVPTTVRTFCCSTTIFLALLAATIETAGDPTQPSSLTAHLQEYSNISWAGRSEPSSSCRHGHLHVNRHRRRRAHNESISRFPIEATASSASWESAFHRVRHLESLRRDRHSYRAEEASQPKVIATRDKRFARRHKQKYLISAPNDVRHEPPPHEPALGFSSQADNEKSRARATAPKLIRAVGPNGEPDEQEEHESKVLAPQGAPYSPNSSSDGTDDEIYYLHTSFDRGLFDLFSKSAADEQQQPNSTNSSSGARAPHQLSPGAHKRLPIKRIPMYNDQTRVPFCLGHNLSETIFSWECQGYEMNKVPGELEPKPNSLRLSKTGLEVLPSSALSPYSETLRDFSIESASRLTRIEPDAFRGLTKLRVVYIFRAPRLKSFDRAITGKHPDLTAIRIQQTGLTTWPDLSQFEQDKILNSIDLDNNQIKTLGSGPINIRAELLNLEFNLIDTIEEFTFNGSEIAVLSLSGNRLLTSIHLNAFANLKNLIKLDLSGTSLSQLPTVGLHQLRALVVRDNYLMKQIPSIYVFPMLEEAHLTYAHHCCSFRYPQTHDPSAYEEHVRLQEEINSICSQRMQLPSTPASEPHPARSKSPKSRRFVLNEFDQPPPPPPAAPTPPLGKQSDGHEADTDFEGSFDERKHDAARPSATSTGFDANMSSHPAEGHSSLTKQWLLQNIECGELVMKPNRTRNIVCTPEPDAFNPCEDIMGYSVLRVAVWFVVAASICGNLSVIVVLLGIFSRLSVPKFLQLNLAIGDLFMGVYLALLAVADLTTVGSYFNHAIDWQLGLGCQVAGASSLFASQLSIFTLSVITFERYYTITYSIDLNMRLQLGWAARIMLLGWIYAFASAMLPIFANINSYSKTSICLPLRTIYRLDRVFIIVLLVVDSSVFLIIFVCYLKMYLLILRQKTEATLKERTVAMRMALLVFTDFACWAPIIFFGATAVMGHPLISVTNSKILIVFFYPLNSMANPFLYVISTRQYRRDLNYVISRWQHWRKNLFKKKVDQTNFYNLVNNPYGLAGHQYPAGLNAHLNAVAAVTGVADHLRHYKLAGHHHNHHNGPMCEHNQLIRISNGSNHNEHHNLIDNDCNLQENNGVIRIHEQRLPLDAFKGSSAACGRNQGPNCQFIIRHQILTSKYAPPGIRISNETTTTTLSNCHARRRLLEKISHTNRQRKGLVVKTPGDIAETSEENDTSSNVDRNNSNSGPNDEDALQAMGAKGAGGGSQVHFHCPIGRRAQRAKNCRECPCCVGRVITSETNLSTNRRRKCTFKHQQFAGRSSNKESHSGKFHGESRQSDLMEATSSSQPELEPTETTTATSELTTTSADALLVPTSFDANTSMVCLCSMDEISASNAREQHPSVNGVLISTSGSPEMERDTERTREDWHRHHHHHHHHHHHRNHRHRSRHNKCRTCQIRKRSLEDIDKSTRQHKSDELLTTNKLNTVGSHHLDDLRPKSDNRIDQPEQQMKSPERQHDHQRHHHRRHHHHDHHHRHHHHRRRSRCRDCCENHKDSTRTSKESSVEFADDSNKQTRMTSSSKLMAKISSQHQTNPTHTRRLECNLKPVIECANDADEQQLCPDGAE